MKSKCHLFFETLATKLRIDIIEKLRERPLCVEELSAGLSQERSKVSHALRSLYDCGFVSVKKEGKRRIYSLNKDTVIPVLELVEKHVRRYCKICKKKP